jgi:hypothetical protein
MRLDSFFGVSDIGITGLGNAIGQNARSKSSAEPREGLKTLPYKTWTQKKSRLNPSVQPAIAIPGRAQEDG